MITNIVQGFLDEYNFKELELKINKYVPKNSENILVQLIDHEFQKDFIKKLYPNPLWTNRVYWNVIGRIQDKYEDATLDDIITCVDQYLSDNKMCISQRDILKFIRDSILSHQVDGIAKIETVVNHAIEHEIQFNVFRDTIKHMKAEGRIFEPSEGYYKCI